MTGIKDMSKPGKRTMTDWSAAVGQVFAAAGWQGSIRSFMWRIAKMDQEWLKLVGQMSFVKHVDVKGNHIKIEVEDTRKNKSKLLESALQHQVDLMKFEVNYITLEEIFLKLVVDP